MRRYRHDGGFAAAYALWTGWAGGSWVNWNRNFHSFYYSPHFRSYVHLWKDWDIIWNEPYNAYSQKAIIITSVIFMRNSKYTLKSLITSKVYAMSDISLMCRIQMNKRVLPSRKICDGFLFMKEILSETCGTIWRNSKKVYRGEFNLPRRLSYSQSHSNYELSAVSRDAQTGAEWDVV